MSYTIAITGKGGTGKTTIAGLLVANFVKNNKIPVLAVDADPNSCLDAVLGVKVKVSVGAVREDVREKASENAASGISKREFLELKISESLVEAKGFDLIAMGRPEGPGCYCYANNVLRDVIGEISRNYPWVVIDNEAGLENLSRRIVSKVDLLLFTGDPSQRGIDTIKRLFDLAAEMNISYAKSAVCINRLRDEISETSRKHLESLGADFYLYLPENDELARIAEAGASLLDVSDGNEVYAAINDFIQKLS